MLRTVSFSLAPHSQIRQINTGCPRPIPPFTVGCLDRNAMTALPTRIACSKNASLKDGAAIYCVGSLENRLLYSRVTLQRLTTDKGPRYTCASPSSSIEISRVTLPSTCFSRSYRAITHCTRSAPTGLEASVQRPVWLPHRFMSKRYPWNSFSRSSMRSRNTANSSPFRA